jgi:RND superfamily putative drug exporter
MKLLGRANWWAPGPLVRWWERHGFREGAEAGSGDTSREPQPAAV